VVFKKTLCKYVAHRPRTIRQKKLEFLGAMAWKKFNNVDGAPFSVLG